MGMWDTLGRTPRMGGMLPSLGNGAGMNPTVGRGGYSDTGSKPRWDSFDYIGYRDSQRAPTAGVTAPTTPTIPDTSEAIINRGTEEIAESEREAMRNATANAAAAGVSSPGDLQRGQQRLQSSYAGVRANLARDVRQQQADRAAELDKWKAEMEERKRQFDLSLAAQSTRQHSGGGGGGGGDRPDMWTQDVGEMFAGRTPHLQVVGRGRNREGARDKNADWQNEWRNRLRF